MFSYNKNYNTHKFFPDYLLLIYSFYNPSKSLYNNRLAKTRKLFIKYIFAKSNIRERIS
jgi:hypothetical protein